MWALSLVPQSCTRHVLCPCDPNEPTGPTTPTLAVTIFDTRSGSAAGRKGTLQRAPELALSSKFQAWARMPGEEVSSLSRASEPASSGLPLNVPLDIHPYTRCSEPIAEGTELTVAWEGPQEMGVPSRGTRECQCSLTEDLLVASLPLSRWSPSCQTESMLSSLGRGRGGRVHRQSRENDSR